MVRIASILLLALIFTPTIVAQHHGAPNPLNLDIEVIPIEEPNAPPGAPRKVLAKARILMNLPSQEGISYSLKIDGHSVDVDSDPQENHPFHGPNAFLLEGSRILTVPNDLPPLPPGANPVELINFEIVEVNDQTAKHFDAALPWAPGGVSVRTVAAYEFIRQNNVNVDLHRVAYENTSEYSAELKLIETHMDKPDNPIEMDSTIVDSGSLGTTDLFAFVSDDDVCSYSVTIQLNIPDDDDSGSGGTGAGGGEGDGGGL